MSFVAPQRNQALVVRRARQRHWIQTAMKNQAVAPPVMPPMANSNRRPCSGQPAAPRKPATDNVPAATSTSNTAT